MYSLVDSKNGPNKKYSDHITAADFYRYGANRYHQQCHGTETVWTAQKKNLVFRKTIENCRLCSHNISGGIQRGSTDTHLPEWKQVL